MAYDHFKTIFLYGMGKIIFIPNVEKDGTKKIYPLLHSSEKFKVKC